MTYCVGLLLKDGLVMLSDTRTNAGVDNISTFGKMHVIEKPGDRVICLATAGNLAVSQAVVNLLWEGLPNETDGNVDTLETVPSMFRAVQLAGAAIRQTFRTDGPAMKAQDINFEVSLLLGGQIAGRSLRLFEVYAAGNFIEATEDTPFLQIGEHKYGKPILDRAVTPNMGLHDAVKLALISMDSTLRSNLSVGLPADLIVVPRDQTQVRIKRRVTEDDSYFQMLREKWSVSLREAYQGLPNPDWED